MSSTFSSRLPWELGQNQFSLLLTQKRQNHLFLLNLIETNMTKVGLFEDLPVREFLTPFLEPQILQYEPHPQGLLQAREAIAKDYAQSHGIKVDPQHLLLCASTSEAYAWLFQLLCDPQEEVLFPRPSYPLFDHLAGLCSVKMRHYDLIHQGRWYLEADSLEHVYTPKTKAMVIVHPHNPTGAFLQKQELEAIFQFCRERKMVLISDEVFFDYPLEPHAYKASSIASEAEEQGVLCFVLSGFSKVLGMPQMKLSWMYVTGPEPLRSQAQERLELISDTFLSVGTPIQWAASSLLENKNLLTGRIHHRLKENLNRLKDLLRDTACQLLAPEGGFSAMIRLPNIYSDEEWVLRFLEKEHVICHPGYFYDVSEGAYVVVSLLVEPKAFEEGMRRILNQVKEGA